jgi:hypothetical protein
MFDYLLSLGDKSWHELADIYQGKAHVYGGRVAEHDIEDKKKLIRKWCAGSATPSMETCLELLDGLDQRKYSGIVFWVWISRFLQKTDKRYRILMANEIQRGTDILSPSDFAKKLTLENEALARSGTKHVVKNIFEQLTNLLFYSRHRARGDKARAEQLLAAIKELVGDAPTSKYYITWLEARYHLYCRDMPKALAGYEKAFYEGMYGDPQAETMVLPEWAAIAQKAGDRAALKRIDSRMKILGIYPLAMSAEVVAELRLKAFHENVGAGVCFIESFA